MTRRYTKQISLEKIYERMLEESESNPTIMFVKQDMANAISDCFGYNFKSAYRKADELIREYNLNLCLVQDLRGNHAKQVKDELGITVHTNRKAYFSALEYMFRCENSGREYDLQDWYQKYLVRRKS